MQPHIGACGRPVYGKRQLPAPVAPGGIGQNGAEKIFSYGVVAAGEHGHHLGIEQLLRNAPDKLGGMAVTGAMSSAAFINDNIVEVTQHFFIKHAQAYAHFFIIGKIMGEPGNRKPVGIHKAAADRIALALSIYLAGLIIGALIEMIAHL